MTAKQATKPQPPGVDPEAAQPAHTPEPWEAEDFAPKHSVETQWVIYPHCDNGFIAHLGIDDDRNIYEVAANASRIVACVNALAGLDPEAIPALVEAAKNALGTLEGAVAMGHLVEPPARRTMDALHSALRRVKGEE